ncbi:MAG: hypothetical protein LBQ58_09825 [Synergistaceae bacterium]|nr:hypothetical protein [Synergistaceae bacterium]
MKKSFLVISLFMAFVLEAACALAASTIGTNPEALVQKLNAQSIKYGWKYNDGKKILISRPEYEKADDGSDSFNININQHVFIVGGYNQKTKQIVDMAVVLSVPFAQVDDPAAASNAIAHGSIVSGIIDLFATNDSVNAEAKAMYKEALGHLGEEPGVSGEMKLGKDTMMRYSCANYENNVVYVAAIEPISAAASAKEKPAKSNGFAGTWKMKDGSVSSAITITNETAQSFDFVLEAENDQGNTGDLEGTASIVGPNRAVCKLDKEYGDSEEERYVTYQFTLSKNALEIEVVKGEDFGLYGMGVYVTGKYKK